MRFGLLGPLEVLDTAGTPVDVGGRQPRTLLAVLLAAGGRSVTADAIVDAIWGEDPPPSATGTLHSYVSRLRRHLGPDAPLVLDDAGYHLDIEAALVDHQQFQSLADAGRAALTAGRFGEASATLVEAERLWRGPALAEFATQDFAVGLATRLEERRLTALEDRVTADLALGRHAALVGELSELVAAHPLREGLRMQLGLALYRAGRQAEALRTLAEGGRLLRDELGIEPSRPLRDLEAAILAQDPSLDLASVPVRASDPVRHGDPTGDVHRPIVAAGPDLVGRDHELAQLWAAFDEARAASRFVVVEGEPGIGKTRLADELRWRSAEAGAVAVWGRSDESGAAPALWPWLAPLRALAELSDSHHDVLEELIDGSGPIAPGRALDIQFERFEAIAALLEHVAARAPVVVLLDDLQWADQASLELLGFLAARLDRGVVIVATMRRLEVGRNDAVTDALAAIARRAGSRRVHLRGLDESATAAVLEATIARATSPEVASTIHARSEGNPFYAIELARLFVEEGDPSAAVPASVLDVVRRRVARLPRETVELLGVAAVIGRDVEIGLLTRAAQITIDESLDGLEPAIVHRLLVEVPDQPSIYRFSHALVREVLLGDLSSLRRARLHLRVADAIEAGGLGIDDAEILAEHLWRAAPVGVGLRAALALRRAAEVAIGRVAYAAAEDLLTKAVQLQRTTSVTPEHLSAELDGILRLLEVARARRYFQGAANREILDRAKGLAERCDRRDVLLDVLWFEWSALATSCRAEEAKPLAEAFLALTRDDPQADVRASGYQVWAVRQWGAGRIAEAVRNLDIAIELYRGLPPVFDGFEGEKRLVNRTFWLWMHGVAGDLAAADVFRQFDEMIQVMPDRFAVASICGFAATAAIALGAWKDVDRYVRISVEADPSSQFAFWGGQVLMQRAVVLAWGGLIDESIASFTEGKERYTSIGARSALASFEASLAMHLAIHGRVDDARRAAAGARAELETFDERWNESIVLMAEGAVARAAGDEDTARERFELAIAVADEQGAFALARRATELLESGGAGLR
jgi:DNA-binding SARP family transcriptional activator